MNVKIAFEKVLLVFLFTFCHLTTFDLTNAERSIRVVKRKVTPSVRIHLTNGFSGGNYARKYSYGRPFPNHYPRENYRSNKKYFGKRDGKYGSKNYANGYRTWAPNRIHGGKYNLRIDQGKRGVQSPYRKDPYPFVRDPLYKNINKKRPLRGNHLQRPKPPRNEFEDDYYFPEEANKVDNKQEFDEPDSRSKKRRKNPSNLDIYKRPELKGSYQFGDKKPGYFRKKTKDSPVSYATFVQQSNNDEDYDDEAESSQHAQQVIKTKRKRTKKKSNLKKKNKDVDYQFEQEDGNDGYQSVYVDDYDPTERSSKKQSKKTSSYETNDENQKNYRTKTQQHNTLPPSTPESYANFKQNSQDNIPFAPSYSPPWSQLAGTTAQPPLSSYNTINRHQPPQYQNQYPPINNPPNSYPFLQNPQNQYSNYQIPQNQYNYQTQTNQFGYHQQPQNYLNSQKQLTSTTNQQSNYYSPQEDNTYKNFIVNSQYGTSSQNINDNPPPSVTSYSYQTFPTNGLTKKNPFEETESFYNKNNNNNNNNYYVKSQSLSYLDNSQKYSTRLSVPYQNSQIKTTIVDDETDFLKKHQNLYHKGVSGIPIQGDGYGKEPPKKDYDIGYGDFQFDENPTM